MALPSKRAANTDTQKQINGIIDHVATLPDMSAYDVLTTQGDLIVAGADGVPARLARGAAGTVLQPSGSDLAWTANVAPSGFFVCGPGSTLTIAAGAVTATGSYHLIETEGGAAADDLATINGGVTGAILVLQRATLGHTPTVKDNAGNIRLGADRALSAAADTLTLIKNANGDWHELSFADNA